MHLRRKLVERGGVEFAVFLAITFLKCTVSESRNESTTSLNSEEMDLFKSLHVNKNKVGKCIKLFSLQWQLAFVFTSKYRNVFDLTFFYLIFFDIFTECCLK